MAKTDHGAEAADPRVGAGQATNKGIRARGKSKFGRMFFRIAATASTLTLIILLVFGILYGRLQNGPLVLDSFSPRVMDALNARLGEDLHVSFTHLTLTQLKSGLQLQIVGLLLSDGQGHEIVRTEAAQMSIDPLALLVGEVIPRALVLNGVSLRLSLLANGSVEFATAPTLAPLSNDAIVDKPAQMPSSAFLRSEATRVLQLLVDATTSPGSALNAIDKIGIRKGRLLVSDQALGRAFALNGVDVDLARSKSGTSLTVTGEGPSKRWRLAVATSASSSAQPGGGPSHVVRADLSNLETSDLSMQTGGGTTSPIVDLTLEAHLETRLSSANTIDSAVMTLSSGAGMISLDPLGMEPFLIDSMALKLHLGPNGANTVLDQIDLASGKTVVHAKGDLVFPESEGNPLLFELSTLPGTKIGAQRPNDGDILIEAGNLKGRVEGPQTRLIVDNLSLKGPEINIALSGGFEGGRAPHVLMHAAVAAMPAVDLIRLWPSFAASPARAWFRQRVRAGEALSAKIDLDFNAAVLQSVMHDGPAPASALRVEIAATGLTLDVLPGLPPLTDVTGSGTVYGSVVKVAVSHGVLASDAHNNMQISAGSFVIADTGIKPTPAVVEANMSGTLATTMALLALDALKPYANFPLDPNSIEGKIDGNLQLNIKLGDHVTPKDTQATIAAKISSFKARNLIGKAGFEQGTLTVNADAKGMVAKGQGVIYASKASLELHKLTNKPGKATMAFTLDDADRKKIGLVVPQVSGPIGVTINAGLADTPLTTPHGRATNASAANIQTAAVELDLSKAAIDNPLPGLSKVAGRPARASFNISTGAKSTVLDKLVFDGGGVSFAGTAQLNPDGSLQSAKLSDLKLSSTDSLQVTLADVNHTLKISARGGSFDARSILKYLANPPKNSKSGAPQPGIDLDFQAAKITGHNGRTIGNGQLRLVQRQGRIGAFQLSGTIGKGSLSGTMQANQTIGVHSTDAGELLSFLDIYKNMQGGTLDLSQGETSAQSSGSLNIRGFMLRNEPMLRQITASGNERTNGDAAQAFNATSVPFDKLQVDFSRRGTQINLTNGVIFGPQIGTSVQGLIDFSRNYMDLKGTFVPAYGLNNIFARIPLFGILLGGNRHEGLFAVNFRVSGPISGPTLNVNPLSAIAPGFLRQIFGAGGVPPNFQPKAAQ